MGAFDSAWALLKQKWPKEKPPACIFCGNPETQWREENMMDVQYRLGMSDVPPVFGVWCKNWFADPQKGEDEGCQKFFIPDIWDKMTVDEVWRQGIPLLNTPSRFQEDNV